jgi:peptidoglycan/LPS O-acetylase OafA/YrhL
MTRTTSFRGDIQALRAIAVVGVLLNHLWPDVLVGGFLGVDVFFAISGYLITRHLTVSLRENGAKALAPFWLARARRLLPAALLVVAVSLVAFVVWAPAVLWRSTFAEAIASVTYVENWALTARVVDYFAARSSSTPFMHYWSLSVEEQFYLVWPILLILGAALARRLHRPSLELTVLCVVLAASLVFSAWFSVSQPDAAYFNTFTRAWEFASGSIVAMLSRQFLSKPSAAVRDILGWVGLALIAASFVWVDDQLPLPGVVSVVPVFGALLVIMAGPSDRRGSVSRVIARRPIRFVGDISYSLYLWHWPLIVILPFILVRPWDLVSKLVVLLLATALAWATKVWVEDPVRNSRYLRPDRPRRRYLWLASGSAVIVAVSGIGLWVFDWRTSNADAAVVSSADECFAAAAMDRTRSCRSPHDLASADAALVAASDLKMHVDSGEICMQDRDEAAVLTCEFGAKAEDATFTFALVGDSHAAHWLSALNAIAIEKGWRFVEYLKSSCPGLESQHVVPDWYEGGADSCHSWSSEVVSDVALRDDIDAVLVSALGREYVDVSTGTRTPLAPDAALETWARWTAAGKLVVVLADTPRWNVGDVPTCVERAGLSDPCAVPVEAREGDPFTLAARRSNDPLIALVDLNDHFCDEELCHVAIGSVVAIGDGNHMTSTFSRSLGPYLGTELELLVPAAR